MKHAKKMMLVEVPSTENKLSDLSAKANFIENYVKPQTAFNLNNELKNTLNRTDLDDREKWRQYNQSLQRFLFLLDKGRKQNRWDYGLLSLNLLNRVPNAKSHNMVKDFTLSPKRKDPPRFRPEIPFGQFADFEIPDRYNENPNRGYYDFSNYSRRNLQPQIDQQELLNESLQHALPEFDPDLNISDDDDDEEEGAVGFDKDYDYDNANNEMEWDNEADMPEVLNELKRGSKRMNTNTSDSQNKVSRKEAPPSFSYVMHPPLQRLGTEIKRKINKAKASRLAKEYYSIVPEINNEDYEMVERKKRGRKHVDFIPPKKPKLVKNVMIKLDRLKPHQLIGSQKGSGYIKKWEKYPSK